MAIIIPADSEHRETFEALIPPRSLTLTCGVLVFLGCVVWVLCIFLLKGGGIFLGERCIEIKTVIRKARFFFMILESDGDTGLRVDFAVIHL